MNNHSGSSPPPKTENILYCPGPKLVDGFKGFNFCYLPKEFIRERLNWLSQFTDSGLSIYQNKYMNLVLEFCCCKHLSVIFLEFMFEFWSIWWFWTGLSYLTYHFLWCKIVDQVYSDTFDLAVFGFFLSRILFVLFGWICTILDQVFHFSIFFYKVFLERVLQMLFLCFYWFKRCF